jgi:hypothetical protein
VEVEVEPGLRLRGVSQAQRPSTAGVVTYLPLYVCSKLLDAAIHNTIHTFLHFRELVYARVPVAQVQVLAGWSRPSRDV